MGSLVVGGERAHGEVPVNDLAVALERVVPLQGPLGYLNFSEGKPDTRFQKQLSDACGFLAEQGATEPWQALHDCLHARLEQLRQQGGAFKDASQVEAVLDLAFIHMLP